MTAKSPQVRPVIAEAIKGMSAAQRRWLTQVCRTSGGGVAISCRVLEDGEVVPSNGPLRKLYEKGLIQGKSGGFSRVVHTRDGLEVFRALSTLTPDKGE